MATILNSKAFFYVKAQFFFTNLKDEKTKVKAKLGKLRDLKRKKSTNIFIFYSTGKTRTALVYQIPILLDGTRETGSIDR